MKPNRFQPRNKFNEAKLRELAVSIKKYGLAQPI
ncbi:MAG: ParB N-terminal domain-containing protein [Endomicrobium sp.]|nr:ParB N-terminal domain-containing protein [Endomicrobium sp.]